ncbi:MAG: prepilin-type N-terminal cleavage/methylation domain-containing protein [Pseudohongiellaceae bacterium]|nr:prepilin-type N-terminal cleavage/methylation domain-containing protein [Pseudohongiellaceae bacterium]
MNFFSRKQRGFGLIEILVTLGILSVGILGVAALQSTISKQSAENKTTAEALAIAQSRIEQMRNYSGTISSLDEFNTAYADTNGFANSLTVEGVNADFTRTESIGTSGLVKDVVVRVAWTDSDNDAKAVTLDTDLSFVSPRSVGDVALESTESLVDAPTGRARLGEGQLPEGAETTSNGDGTSLYQDGGTDLMLVYDDQIVLTLAEACQTEEGTCIDFVRIKGTVYIDTASQGSLTPGDVYLVASDAAFCARHYTVDGTTTPVTSDTASTITTDAGDYEYFDYTCYIGGGWHGNVGVILAGGLSQSDKVCIGDPVSINAWEAPVIATRRVYRGMLYKYDLGTDSGREEISDGDGGTLVRYYSQGIADSTLLPDPDSGDSGHDFVIASMASSLNDGSNCTDQGIMVRADSNVDGTDGDLFAGMPTDFICLNDGLLDTYDDTVFGETSSCPYDPSDPPSTRHLVSGTINVLAPETDDNNNLMDSITTLTSDGPGNCLVAPYGHDGTQYQANYQCDVYDWGNGWNGYIEVVYDASSMSCEPNRLSLSNVNGDTVNNDYENCSPGSFAVISGTVTASGNRVLQSGELSDGGVCDVAADGLSYQCVTAEFEGDTWTGTMTLVPTGGDICSSPNNDGVFSFSGLESGFVTQNVTIQNNANQCL